MKVNEQSAGICDVLEKGMYSRLFPETLRLLPDIKEVYELALAFYESRILGEEEILRSGAYFSKVNGIPTHHFQMCIGDAVKLPDFASSRRKSFFEKAQFRTGYATHGLFPYRGKFHPQMIKALLNIMGLKPGETVLDPMMGSGTVLVEASLMGLESIGIDSSPFCRFMAASKYEALSVPITPLRNALEQYGILFDIFSMVSSRTKNDDKKVQNLGEEEIFHSIMSSARYSEVVRCEDKSVFKLLLLAYLDSAGYSARSKQRTPVENFYGILERYLFVVDKIQRVLKAIGITPAQAAVVQGDAQYLPLDDSSVDGILFSPPYSFAINYLKNDEFHLDFLGADLLKLKNIMIGLRGRTIKEKYANYTEDMDKVLAECARVLRPYRFCTIIIGTNDNQLSKALGIQKNQVRGLHQVIIDLSKRHGLMLVRKLARQISGIANTMRSEYILILKKS